MIKSELKEYIKDFLGTKFYPILDEVYLNYKETGTLKTFLSDATIDSVVNKFKNRQAFGRQIERRCEFELSFDIKQSFENFVRWMNDKRINWS